MRFGGALLAAVLIALLGGCGSDADPPLSKPPTPLRIMALGDSITDGPYYRHPLMDRLDERDCVYDLVGSQTDVDDGNDRAGYDPDHEGYGGWRADELREGVVEWTTAARPEVVLLHVGINDLYASQSPGSTAQDIEGIIAGVRTANPGIAVLLAQIIPGAGVEEQVDDLNADLALMANQLDRSDSRVVLVDQNTGFDVEADTVDDNVHPNAAGGEKMAARWFEGLASVSDAACFGSARAPLFERWAPAVTSRPTWPEDPVAQAKRVTSDELAFSAARWKNPADPGQAGPGTGEPRTKRPLDRTLETLAPEAKGCDGPGGRVRSGSVSPAGVTIVDESESDQRAPHVDIH